MCLKNDDCEIDNVSNDEQRCMVIHFRFYGLWLSTFFQVVSKGLFLIVSLLGLSHFDLLILQVVIFSKEIYLVTDILNDQRTTEKETEVNYTIVCFGTQVIAKEGHLKSFVF